MSHPADSVTTADHPVPETEVPTGTSRRTVLRAAGLVAVAGGATVIAACSSSATPATPAAPSVAPSAGPSSSAGGAAGGASVSKADVPVGGGFIMTDGAYVVTQPKAGEFKAFSKICTHKGCPVSSVENAQIICKCHQSHYSITDGSVLSGPAPKPLPAAKATVSGDKIDVSA